MSTFFIADLHFGHKNMSIQRGFNSVEEHDNHIIERWNSVVNKRDIVWILGDVTMEKVAPYPLLNKLKGMKKVVLGNHDKPQHAKNLLEYVNSVCAMVRYKGHVLSHCPLREENIPEGLINLHGHVHENTVPHERYINVSAEVIDYTPILFDNLESLIYKEDNTQEYII